MTCPKELTDIVLELLTIGLLRIRRYGEMQMAERCAIEADHIHNLPALLKHYSPDLLSFYWVTERQSFLQQIPADERSQFDSAWEDMEEFIQNCNLGNTNDS